VAAVASIRLTRSSKLRPCRSATGRATPPSRTPSAPSARTPRPSTREGRVRPSLPSRDLRAWIKSHNLPRCRTPGPLYRGRWEVHGGGIRTSPTWLGIPVADQEPPRHSLIAKADQQVASLLGNPQARGMVGDAAKVHPPAAKLNEEQHMQPAQPDRIDGEEVARDDPGGLLAPTPGRRGASRRRVKTVSAQHPPDRAGRHRTPNRRISPWMRW